MKLRSTLALALAAGMLASCAKTESETGNPKSGNFILTVTPAATTGVADYLLTSETLDSDTISTKGNGIEQDGSYRYYVTHNGKFFSMLYGQSNPGAVTAYTIQNGKLNKLTNFQTETVQAFAPVNDDLLLFKISRSLTAPTSSWYKVNTNSLTITAEGTVNTLEMTGVGELGHFTWIKQVGTKVFAPYQTINDRSFNTKYPNQGSIAIFNYADMKLEKVITDTRISFIGRYFQDGLSVQENGDVYGFSPASAITDGKITTTKPSAIVKIKSGTTEFDQSYFFDVEAASNGLSITSWLYLGNNTYLVSAAAKAEKTSTYPAGLRLGIVNVVDKTYKAVTGMPELGTISSLTTNNYTPKDGKTGYIGVNFKDGTSYVYKIHAGTQKATRGLRVEGGTLTAVQHLD